MWLGLVISCTPRAAYIQSKFEPLSFLLLTPVFFASVGIKANVSGMDARLVIFSVLLLLVSIITKIIGCGLGAKLCRFTGKESLQVGVGMVCRGEVALIVANRGLELGVLSAAMMAPVIITVVGGTILTPRHAQAGVPARRTDGPGAADGSLTDHYNKMEQLDLVSAELLDKDRKYLKEGERNAGGPRLNTPAGRRRRPDGRSGVPGQEGSRPKGRLPSCVERSAPRRQAAWGACPVSSSEERNSSVMHHRPARPTRA